MGREVRRVPAEWAHPKDPSTGRFKSLFNGSDYGPRVEDWDSEFCKWEEGLRRDYKNGGWEPHGKDCSRAAFSEYCGDRPDAADYMPVWADEQCTHYMMFETTSEGTPISPAFATPEELARWLSDSRASAFGDQTASYEAWLRVCNGGFAPSAILSSRGIESGVEALRDAKV